MAACASSKWDGSRSQVLWTAQAASWRVPRPPPIRARCVATVAAVEQGDGLPRTSSSIARRRFLDGSLWWKIAQQVHGRGQVIVSGDGVDLPLGQLDERLRLDPLRARVWTVVGQHVVGEFGGPFELAGPQCIV